MTAQPGFAVSRDASNNGTTPKAFRLAVGGLLAGNGASGVDVRKGVLWDGAGNVVTGAAGMTYNVRACRCVVMSSATQGPIIVPNDASVSIATTAAPGANSRYDVIWVRQHLVAADGGADSDVIGELGVTQGTAAAAPTVPAIPTGAVELARVVVTSGTTATNTLTIQQTHVWTVANGAPIPVRNATERAALTAVDGLMVCRLDTHVLERYDGTTWKQIIDDAADDTGWVVPALSNSWVSYDAGAVFDIPAYRRRDGAVRLKGLMKSGTAGTTVLTLPVGCRPLKKRQFNLQSNSSVCRASIDSAGVLQVVGYDTGGSNASVSLDQIFFDAEQ